MKTNLNDWLEQTAVIQRHGYQDTRKHLKCNDGTTLSVQSSQMHYCEPRVNQSELNGQKYTHIEVWCVSAEVPESWLEYGDPEDDPFAYIPVEMVEEFIDSHGGIKE